MISESNQRPTLIEEDAAEYTHVSANQLNNTMRHEGITSEQANYEQPFTQPPSHNTLEETLDKIGFGAYQVLLMQLCGMGWFVSIYNVYAFLM